MKKREISIKKIGVTVVVFCVILFVGMLYCKTSLERLTTDVEYDTSQFGETFKFYWLGNSEKVLFEFNGTYLLGDHTAEETCPSYFSIYLGIETWRDAQVVSVSPKYIVFSVNDTPAGTTRCEIAVEVEESEEYIGGEQRTFHKSIRYEDMNWWDKLFLVEVTGSTTVKDFFYSEL